MRMPSHDHLAATSARWYRRLLVAYPPAFRGAYGDAMTQLFRDTCRDALRRHGRPGLLVAWAGALRDLAASALAQDLAERGRPLPPSPLVRWTGPMAALGGLLWASLYTLAAVDRYAGLRWAGRPLLAAFDLPLVRSATPFAVVLLLLLPGVLGLLAWEGGRLARSGQAGAVLASLGMATFVASAATVALGQGRPRLGALGEGGTLGATVACLGVALLAIRLRRAAPACRLGALLVLPYAVAVAASTALRLGLAPWGHGDVGPPRLVMYGLAVLFGLGWLRLGLALWRAPRLPVDREVAHGTP